MKKNYPFRVAVSGCNGRMGRQIIRSLRGMKDLVLTVVLCREKTESVEMFISSILKKKSCRIIIHNDIKQIKDEFDVLIDCTNPEISLSYLKDCHLYKKNMVIGTTGFSHFQMNQISVFSRDIGIVLSENFSIGINTIFLLLEKIVKNMGEDTDIDIVEMHHSKKCQIPSGTSIKIKNIIKKTCLERCSSSIRKKEIIQKKEKEKIKKKKITIHSIRAKNVLGEHSILFFTDKERLEIRHQVHDFSIFSDGAIRAALWIQIQKKKGLFSMLDVLNLKNEI